MRTELDSELYDAFLRANDAWECGRLQTAFELFRTLAAKGYVHAMHNLGYFFDSGIGVRKNTSIALKWYKRAWAVDRQSGTGINIAKAYAAIGRSDLELHWLRKLTKQSDPDAALEYLKLRVNVARRAERLRLIALCSAAAQWPNATHGVVEEILVLQQSLKSNDLAANGETGQTPGHPLLRSGLDTQASD